MADVVWRCGCGHPATLGTSTCPACGWRVGGPPARSAVTDAVDVGVGVTDVDRGGVGWLPRPLGLALSSLAGVVVSSTASWYVSGLLMGRLEVVVAVLFVVGSVMLLGVVGR